MTRSVKYWLLQGLNFFGFKAAWWGCILGAGWDKPWLVLVSMGAFLVVHYAVFKPTREETRFLIVLGLLGTGIDTLKASVGLIGYATGYSGINWLAPFWITALWVGFGATMGHSMNFLSGRPLLAFVLGAVFGPISYLTGFGFGAVWFPRGDWLALTVIGLVWGISLPAIYWLSVAMGLNKTSETNEGTSRVL